jgi:ferredoxin--NADP+ reductase
MMEEGRLMTTPIGTEQRPLRVAVVGSGPSGFYAAEALLNSQHKVTVDMFERLPVPFGLVRYGVAPDHAKIKNVIKVYERTATRPEFVFFGNVMVGKDFSVDELKSFYDAVIFACGAQTDRRLGIPGEDLPGSCTATEFVGWYNGHPDYRSRSFDLSHQTAVIIGQGNVAMDVCRILAKTVDELKKTDIARHALESLAESKIKDIHLIGRRGPVQAAFTPSEIREFGELADCDPLMDPRFLQLNEVSCRELADLQAPFKKKNFDILTEYAHRRPSGKGKRLIIHFLKSPVELRGGGRLDQVVLEHNQLTGEINQQKAVGTGVRETLPCGLLFRSVGYRGVAVPGVPFDEKAGIFANQAGRIIRHGAFVSGLYCVGWIKRGPSGIIGTNKPDSAATVENLFADLPKLSPCPHPQRPAVEDFLREKGIRCVSFADWKKIDAVETARGAKMEKPREKFVSVQEMMSVIESLQPGK